MHLIRLEVSATFCKYSRNIVSNVFAQVIQMTMYAVCFGYEQIPVYLCFRFLDFAGMSFEQTRSSMMIKKINRTI